MIQQRKELSCCEGGGGGWQWSCIVAVCGSPPAGHVEGRELVDPVVPAEEGGHAGAARARTKTMWLAACWRGGLAVGLARWGR
jgi:hypothetical protein